MMDKNYWFPVFIGTKSDPIKVNCNCDGWSILEKVGFVKSERDLPVTLEEPKAKKPKKEVE
jgi:hypothetical protein